MSSESADKQLDHCPGCQSLRGPGEGFCWMCGRKLWEDRTVRPKPSESPRIQASETPPKPAPRAEPVPSAAPPLSFVAGNSWFFPSLIACFLLILLAMCFERGRILIRLGVLAGLLMSFFGIVRAGFRFVSAVSRLRPAKTEPVMIRSMTRLASFVAVVILGIAAFGAAMAAVYLGMLAFVALISRH